MLVIAERRNNNRIRAIGACRLAKFSLRRGDRAAALAWLEAADVAAQHIGWRWQIA